MALTPHHIPLPRNFLPPGRTLQTELSLQLPSMPLGPIHLFNIQILGPPITTNHQPQYEASMLPNSLLKLFARFLKNSSRTTLSRMPRHLVTRCCPSDPTRMRQICSRWRTVALSRPELWSKIYIHNPNASQVYLVRICLERAGNRLLDLGISHDGEDHKFDVRSASRILSPLHSRLEYYWRDRNFQLPFQFLRTLLAMIQCDQRPVRLECVSIGFMGSVCYPYEAKFDPPIDAIWKFFHRSPKLTKVDWRGRGVDNFPKHAPFRQPTHVRTNFTLSIGEVLSFLATVPRIEELSIESIRRKPQKDLELRRPPTFATTSSCPLFTRCRFRRISFMEVLRALLSRVSKLITTASPTDRIKNCRK